MVKILRDKTFIKLTEGIKKLEDITSRILCNEKINYTNDKLSFIIGDNIAQNGFKAFVSLPQRIIQVYERHFFLNAKKLAKAYEDITKKDILKGYTFRGKWTIQQMYND